jgi:hypothetical protein
MVAWAAVVATVPAVALTATPAHAAEPWRQLPAQTIVYSLTNAYLQNWSAVSPDNADASWRTDGLQAVVNQTRSTTPQIHYIDRGVVGTNCNTNGALACAVPGPNVTHTSGGCDANAACTIWVMPQYTWYDGTASPPSTAVDLWSALTHEKGHWMGCGHTTAALYSDYVNSQPTMTATMAQGTTGNRTIQADDINCVKAVRLAGDRNIAANSGLECYYNSCPGTGGWGGAYNALWTWGGAGGNGPTSGVVAASCGGTYGNPDGSCAIGIMSGGGANPVINWQQGYQEITGDDSVLPWDFGRPRRVTFQMKEDGISAFFTDVIVAEGFGDTSSATVDVNYYCSDLGWQRWTTCTTPYFTSTSGKYTLYVYNGSQQPYNSLYLDNIKVQLQ